MNIGNGLNIVLSILLAGIFEEISKIKEKNIYFFRGIKVGVWLKLIF